MDNYAVKKNKTLKLQLIFLLFTACSLNFSESLAFFTFDEYGDSPLVGDETSTTGTDVSDFEVINKITGRLKLVHTDYVIRGDAGFDLKVNRVLTEALAVRIPELYGNDRLAFQHVMTLSFGYLGNLYWPNPCVIPSTTVGGGGAAATYRSYPTFYDDAMVPHVLYPSAPQGQHNTYFYSTDNWRMVCSASGQIIINSPDGVDYYFDRLVFSIGGETHTTYRLARKQDVNGNAYTFQWSLVPNAYFRGTTAGTTWILKTIKYNGTLRLTVNHKKYPLASEDRFVVDSVVADGKTWAWKRTCVNFRLFDNTLYTDCDPVGSVTGPEGLVWRYKYNAEGGGPSFMPMHVREVTTPYGAKIVYQYYTGVEGQELRLSSKSIYTDGIIYPDPIRPESFRAPDYFESYSYSYDEYTRGYTYTTVRDSDGNKTRYKYCNTRVYVNAGYNSNCPAGEGSLLQVQHFRNQNDGGGLVQQTSYEWGFRTISAYAARSFYELDFQYNFNGNDYFYADEIAVNFGYNLEARQPLLTNQVIKYFDPVSGLVISENHTDFLNHDSYGNPQQKRETSNFGEVRVTDYTYYNNPAKWIIGKQKSEDLSENFTQNGIPFTHPGVSIVYDTNGRVKEEHDYGAITKYTYYSNGNINTITDPFNKITTLSNYKLGIAQLEDNPDTTTITRVVDNEGNIRSITDEEGNTTSYTYDGLQRIATITTPEIGDANIINTYSFTGKDKKTTRGNLRESEIYDGLGRTVEAVRTDLLNGVNIKTTQTLDQYGRVKFSSYPNSTDGINTAYDALGRITNITRSVDNIAITYDYYRGDGLIVVNNERNNETQYTYRSFGDEKQLIQISEPESVVTDIVRTNRGDVRSITINDVTEERFYDGNYNHNKTIRPESFSQHMDFDTGNRIYRSYTISNNAGVPIDSIATTYGYDDRGRVKNINYPDALSSNITYAYYGNGELKSAGNMQSSWAYTYDKNNNLKSETFSTNNDAYTISYDYDQLENQSSITYPNGIKIDFSPDVFGRPTKASYVIDNVDYYSDGQIAHIDYANGKTYDMQRNTRQLPEFLTVPNTVGLTYTYDGKGNIKFITDAITATNSKALTYDGKDRLVTAAGSFGNRIYGYMPNGNIDYIDINNTLHDYVYSPADGDSSTQDNILSQITNSSYMFGYDDKGNVTANGSHSYTYNLAKQLVSVPDINQSFKYDANNKVYEVNKAGEVKYLLYSKDGGKLYRRHFDVEQNEDVYIYLGSKNIGTIRNGTGDADNDGLNDITEYVIGSDDENPDSDYDGVSDGDEDLDGDGLTNLAEMQNSTLPWDPDTDNDGMKDGYEVQYGLNPLSNDAADDPDVDGLSNLQESQYGTDPHKADTDGDGVNDGAEIAAGTNPLFNLAAFIPIINLILF